MELSAIICFAPPTDISINVHVRILLPVVVPGLESSRVKIMITVVLSRNSEGVLSISQEALEAHKWQECLAVL